MPIQPSTAATVIVTVGAHRFLVHPDVRIEVPATNRLEERYIPASVVRSQKVNFTKKELDGIIAEFSKADDVWDENFLQGKCIYTHVKENVTLTVPTSNPT